MDQQDSFKAEFDLVLIFEQYHREIYGFLFTRLNRDQHLAEDLTQDVFLKAWRNRDSFDPAKAGIRHWLYVIARRLLIDYLRSQKPEEPLTESVDQTSPGDDYQQIENHVMLDFVLQKMQGLSDEDQELLTLRYINDLDLEEIADITDRSYEAVKMGVHRALKRLKHLVEL